MEPGGTAKLRITGSRNDAITAIREALPDDAIVRDQDDGVGRFAGDRIVMLIGTGRDRLMMSRGNWRLMKTLEENPQLEISFEDRKGGCTVRMKAAEIPKAGLGSIVGGAVTNALTIGILVVAYHMFQDMEIDKAKVAGISAGGGTLWAVVAHFWPKKRDDALDKTIRGALRPMLAPKKPKKKKHKDKDDAASNAEA
jgi:hypothetical protein